MEVVEAVVAAEAVKAKRVRKRFVRNKKVRPKADLFRHHFTEAASPT